MNMQANIPLILQDEVGSLFSFAELKAWRVHEEATKIYIQGGSKPVKSTRAALAHVQ